MGVTFENGKYRARISIGGNKRRSLGRYDTKRKAQLAIARYKQAEELDRTQEDELEQQINQLGEGTLLQEYEAAHPVEVDNLYKPSLWARIKSIWQSIRQQS